MEKYIQIRDMRTLPSYHNALARLLYLHLACSCDISSYNVQRSTRVLARELGCSHSALRHALRQLLEDDLCRVVPTTQPTTQRTTQQATHLHIVRISELQPTNDTANDTASDTASDTHSKIIKQEITTTHTMRACGGELANLAAKEFGLDAAASAAAVDAFLRRQELKAKEWENKGDAVAHFVCWLEKRLPRKPAAPVTDAAARSAEYQRAKEEAAAATAADRQREELERLLRWKEQRVQTGLTSGDAWESLCNRIGQLQKTMPHV